MLNRPIQITKIIANVLEKLEIPYLVGGSLASSLHGIPRSTQDVDLVADIQIQHIDSFVKALEKDFYVSSNMIKEAIHNHSSFNVIHLESMFKIDIFVIRKDESAKEEMGRRKKYLVSEKPKLELVLSTAEDTILQKIRWFQMGGETSEKQWKDVQGILQIKKGKLDLDYLNKGATQLGINELLEKILKETS